jgi:hypothetical protein
VRAAHFHVSTLHMAGMFNSPCCWTCAHGRALADEVVAARPYGCVLHQKQLPTWLPSWRNRLAICNQFKHYSVGTGISPERIQRVFPRGDVLYCYPDDYGPAVEIMCNFGELPSL